MAGVNYIWDFFLRKKTQTYYLLAEYCYKSSNRSIEALIEIEFFSQTMKETMNPSVFVEKINHVGFFFFLMVSDVLHIKL